MRTVLLVWLLAAREAQTSHSSEHVCDDSTLVAGDSAYQRTLQAAAADVCLDSASTLAAAASQSAVSAAATTPLPERAVVHVAAKNLAEVASRLTSLPADARLTLLVSGAEDQATPPVAAALDALVKDDRVAHVFQLVHGTTIHKASEGTNRRGRSKATKLSMLPARHVGGTSASACEQLRSSLERVWGVHEAALLEQDRSGSALAQYYRAVAHHSPRVVPQYGTKLYYVYARPYSDLNCEQRIQQGVDANGSAIDVPVVTCVPEHHRDWWYDDWYDSGWAIFLYVVLGLCFASSLFYFLFYVVFDGHKKSHYDSV